MFGWLFFDLQVARNWISSPTPLDTPMNTPEFDIPRVSAGKFSTDFSVFQV